jgi:hypothetical protein
LNFSRDYTDDTKNVYSEKNFEYFKYINKSTNTIEKNITHSFNSYVTKKALNNVNDKVQLKRKLNSADDKKSKCKNKIEFLSKKII